MSGPITGKPEIGVTKWVNIATTPTTLAPNTYDQIVYTGGAGATTLPLASASVNGAKIAIKNMGTGALTVNANGTDVIFSTAAVPLGVANISIAVDASNSLVADTLHGRWIKIA